MVPDKHIITLHRYFIAANRMRIHFERVLKTRAKDDKNTEAFLYMSYWYGGMYVVIEGWNELGLSDPKIDMLLNSPNVGLLRRYRNGVFHFQRDYYDEHFVEFMRDGPDCVDWIHEVTSEFGRFFLDWFERKKETK